MKTNANNVLKCIFAAAVFATAMPSMGASFAKYEGVKGEAAQQSNSQSKERAISFKQLSRGGQAAASMTPEQTEKLRKALKEAIKAKKPPCGINSNC